jgi:hypothetical protein
MKQVAWKVLYTSYAVDESGPEGFYSKLGFTRTRGYVRRRSRAGAQIGLSWFVVSESPWANREGWGRDGG